MLAPRLACTPRLTPPQPCGCPAQWRRGTGTLPQPKAHDPCPAPRTGGLCSPGLETAVFLPALPCQTSDSANGPGDHAHPQLLLGLQSEGHCQPLSYLSRRKTPPPLQTAPPSQPATKSGQFLCSTPHAQPFLPWLSSCRVRSSPSGAHSFPLGLRPPWIHVLSPMTLSWRQRGALPFPSPGLGLFCTNSNARQPFVVDTIISPILQKGNELRGIKQLPQGHQRHENVAKSLICTHTRLPNCPHSLRPSALPSGWNQRP